MLELDNRGLDFLKDVIELTVSMISFFSFLSGMAAKRQQTAEAVKLDFLASGS